MSHLAGSSVVLVVARAIEITVWALALRCEFSSGCEVVD